MPTGVSVVVEQGGKEGREQNADDGVPLNSWSTEADIIILRQLFSPIVCVCRVANEAPTFQLLGRHITCKMQRFLYFCGSACSWAVSVTVNTCVFKP